MLHKNLTVNEKGHLAIAGFDAVDLAKKYGTPLYVLDEDFVRRCCRVYVNSMRTCFGPGSMPLYASKALSFRRMYEIAAEEGMGVDVVSGGELYTALAAKFPAERIYFHGNCKTLEEIRLGVESGVGYFVADNPNELALIDAEAKRLGKKQKIILRLTPGIDTHTFEAVRTGQVDSKFGASIETGQAFEFTKLALGYESLDLRGFHCHIGSQIFDEAPFCDAAAIMLDYIAKVKKELGFETEILNLGGGLGVRYTDADPEPDYAAAIAKISDYVNLRCAALALRRPDIIMEPGRSLVAAAGVTLYTVGNVKTIPGYKNYIAIDGGMGDNPRFALYEAKHTALIADRAGEPADFVCDVAGKCCESGDLIGKDMHIQTPKVGDTAAVLVTGAYNYAMASNYNRIPRPPVVMLSGGKDYVAVRRETYADLIMYDM
ncbi:MAG: diaminopimelate decarboxylase [Oscillospiraceae bacterium]|nr:diaminopimelate decarboxylase [Oscillospiraceae bacterium]